MIFRNILASKYRDGCNILDALIKLKLFSVLNYLTKQNQKAQQSFLSDIDIARINERMGGVTVRQKYSAWPA